MCETLRVLPPFPTNYQIIFERWGRKISKKVQVLLFSKKIILSQFWNFSKNLAELKKSNFWKFLWKIDELDRFEPLDKWFNETFAEENILLNRENQIWKNLCDEESLGVEKLFIGT